MTDLPSATEIAAWMVGQGWTDDAILSTLDERYGEDSDVHEAIHRVRYRDGSPTCPHCHQMPRLVISRTQAFCGNDDCDVLMWDPSMTDGGISGAQTIDLSGFIPLDQPGVIRDDEGPAAASQRAALPGERCTCGRQAVFVFLGGSHGDVGYCGRPAWRTSGPCPFCGGPRHEVGPCPQYQLSPGTPRQ